MSLYFFIKYDNPTVCMCFNSRADWLGFTSQCTGIQIASERYAEQHMSNYGLVIKSKAALKSVALDSDNCADIRLAVAVMFIRLKG